MTGLLERMRWSAGQVGLAVVASLGICLAFGSLAQASSLSAFWYLLAFVPLVGLAYSNTLLPILVGFLVLTAWAVHVPVGSFSWWSVGGGIGLAVWHSATSLSAALPPGGPLPRRLAGRWVVRTALVAVTAPLAALLAALVPQVAPQVTVIAAIVALVGVSVAIWVVRSEPVAERE